MPRRKPEPGTPFIVMHFNHQSIEMAMLSMRRHLREISPSLSGIVVVTERRKTSRWMYKPGV